MKIKRHELTPFVMNCYVLEDDGEAVVVDPGEASPRLLNDLAALRVKMIINTHCHCDHAGGNAGVKAATGAPLACHADDLPLLEAIEQQGVMFGVHFPPSPPPDTLLKAGDTIVVGSQRLEVRHAPGHSPGHVVLVGDGFVLAGDVLFAGSIGRTDLPGGNYGQLLQSIRTELMTLPDDTVVYSGHGPDTTIGVERRTNPFLVNP
ncbi:MAG TPA: MBL fold metallo-hydrolase [Candidatus Hydrogenedentes bacterium]|nr:MBL fold metallo-hydrolase [Candidatus Hydrogenedentota bacterium]HOC72185.1 MBL fold metallo-hydrolase [Candidatus Hydrogenedentota bacterium]HOH50685.1 MBL fold metallo-hydrolase [Candidatus Hydrogenedentota bacterium]HQL95194.1 MBL fold metallo-hydrolase [Candidatus Hydrogenedentota bacterium]HRZ81355.1 MBL fold metallo-hydrolase [Candidatus Hydrogenedentota bacterium]